MSGDNQPSGRIATTELQAMGCGVDGHLDPAAMVAMASAQVRPEEQPWAESAVDVSSGAVRLR
jgi:hypothetical protein